MDDCDTSALPIFNPPCSRVFGNPLYSGGISELHVKNNLQRIRTLYPVFLKTYFPCILIFTFKYFYILISMDKASNQFISDLRFTIQRMIANV